MALLCKTGVSFRVLRPEIYQLFGELTDIFARHGVDCVITSANDSTLHKIGSLHYRDLAIDLRSQHLAEDKKMLVYQELRDMGGATYQVIFEGRGSWNEHFHLEYDPH